MKRVLNFCQLFFLLACLLASTATAQLGNDLDTTLEGLSDSALSSGVNDDGQVFYSVGDTEFGFEVNSDLVTRMDGTAIMDEDGIAFVSRLFAVATGFGADIETNFVNFFNDSLPELVQEENLTFPIESFTMAIDVTGDEAPYNAAFALYFQEIATDAFPKSIHTKGSEDAEFVIREFSDLQCPACQRFHQSTMPYVEELIAEGKVRFEFHHLPLASIHDNAVGAARAIECVSEHNGDDGFWAYHDELFERQRAWENLDEPSGYFVRLSDELGLASDEIKGCIEEERYADLVTEAMIKASDLQLNSTPSVFVNGLRVGNWLDTDLFESTMVLARALEEASEATE